MASDTVTRTVLRQRLMEPMGVFVTSTTTGAGAGDGTTVVDTEIQKFSTDRITNKWLYITSGDAAGEERRISSVSTSTITVAPAFSAQIASGVTYEVMPWRPTEVHRALEHGIRSLPPQLYVPKRDETLIVDNLLSNSSFETSTAGPVFTNWSSIGTPTLAAETAKVMHGSQSAKVTASGAVEGLEQNILGSLDINEQTTKTLHVRGWVWADAASAARLRVTYDGSAYDNSDYHAGNAEWEYLIIDSTIDSAATEATVSFEVADGEVAYCDLLVAWVDPVTQYTIPSDIVSLRQVHMQQDIHRPRGNYHQFTTPKSGHILRLKGLGRLSIPSTDAGTTEMDDEMAEAVIARAASWLFQQQAGNDPGSRSDHLENAKIWGDRFSELISRGTLHSPRMSADPPIGWHVEEDSSNRFLIMDAR